MSEQLVIFMMAVEDLYNNKLLEAHIQTGCRRKDKMPYYAKNKWKVRKPAFQLFAATYCKTCNRKRAAPKKGVIVKPIISGGFNMRK